MCARASVCAPQRWSPETICQAGGHRLPLYILPYLTMCHFTLQCHITRAMSPSVLVWLFIWIHIQRAVSWVPACGWVHHVTRMSLQWKTLLTHAQMTSQYPWEAWRKALQIPVIVLYFLLKLEPRQTRTELTVSLVHMLALKWKCATFFPPVFPSDIIFGTVVLRTVLAKWSLVAAWLLPKAEATVRTPNGPRNCSQCCDKNTCLYL